MFDFLSIYLVDENSPEYRFSQIEKRVRNSLAKRKYVKYVR